jgi:hypothetical protein
MGAALSRARSVLMKRLIALMAVSAALAACSDGPTEPSPTTVAAIVINAPSTTMQVGSTMTATARLLNSKGDTVPSKTPKWATSNASVATVDQNGVIIGVAAGSATITASADNAKGTLPLTVDVDRCVNPLSLNVGQVSIQSGPNAVSCIAIAAATAPGQLLFITANATPVSDDRQTFLASIQTGTAASSSPAASLFGSGVSPELRQVAASLERRDNIETRIRSAEGRIVRAMAARGVTDAAAERAATRASASVMAVAVGVGDTITYRVPNVLVSDLCNNFASIRAVVKAVGKKAQIAQDITASANGFTSADFTAIAAEFDNLIFKTDTAWFGAPTDINKDGRITILYTPEVNKFTTKGSNSYIGGFFWGGDLFTKADYTQAGLTCPQTNEQEIFYLLAADPTGTYSDPRSTALVRQATRGTIAHEFQHMINQGIRQFNPAVEDFEVDWLNEGLSHFAEEAVGRASRGFSDFQSLTSAEVRANVDDYNAFFQQNLARFSTWLARPDTSSPISSRADRDLAPRGAAWALLRYTADQFAPTNARAFFRRLVAGPKTGVTNLVQHAGVPFDQIISGWLIANYTDDLGISGLDARYSYRSWSIRDAVAGVANGTYPLRVLTPGAPVTTTAQSGSGVYFLAQRASGAPASTFRMLDPNGNKVAFDGARVYVVRVN